MSKTDEWLLKATSRVMANAQKERRILEIRKASSEEFDSLDERVAVALASVYEDYKSMQVTTGSDEFVPYVV